MQTIQFSADKQERLDSFLLKRFPSLSFGKLCKFHKENKIKINKKKEPLSYKLQKGDLITLYILEIEGTPIYLSAKDTLNIVYEDDYLLIVNKPQGLICIDENNQIADTLINRVLKYTHYNDSFEFKPALCHRLDTGTEGLIIIAKNKDACDEMLSLIKEHKIQKEYKCICYGIPTKTHDIIHSFFVKDNKTGIIKSFKTQVENSKEAITEYNLEESKNNYSLINVVLHTGRTHQIRVHLSQINCPILGDTKYGNVEINNTLSLKRQKLLSYKITFPSLKVDTTLSNKIITLDTTSFYDYYSSLINQ